MQTKISKTSTKKFLNNAVQAHVNMCKNSFSLRKPIIQEKSFQQNNENLSISESDVQEDEKSQAFNIQNDKEALKQLKNLTHNFLHTYKQISKKPELFELPLSNYTKEEIQEEIRISRQKNSRQKSAKSTSFKNSIINKSNKRNRDLEIQSIDAGLNNKRFKQDATIIKEESQINQFLSLARNMIVDFQNQEKIIQQRIIKQVATMFKDDESLMQYAIMYQTKNVFTETLQYFKDREYQMIFDLFEALSPMTNVKINIKVAKSLPQLADEGSTLSRTFLPYLKFCLNFEFIEDKYNTIASKFTHSLVQYYQDTSHLVDEGFIRFALEFSPSKLQPIITRTEDQKSLVLALKQMKYCDDSCEIISLFPQKFLWTELINFLQKIEQQEKSKIIKILSKLIIIQDPGLIMPQLMNIFAKREIFYSLLLEKDKIQLNPQQLIHILELLQEMQTDSIRQCFLLEDCQWQNFVQKSINQEDLSDKQLNEKQIIEFLKLKEKEYKDFQFSHFEEILKCSKFIEQHCCNYQHNLYQCAIAALTISNQNLQIIVEMPTASGKTFVQNLVAMYHIFQGKKVLILEPNEILRIQTEELIGDTHSDLSISTIQWFYTYPSKEQVIIINEFDSIIEEQSFYSTNQQINGIWSFQNRTTYFFSATQNKAFERIIKMLLGPPVILKFSSEFEMLTKTSSLQGGQIKICKDKNDAFSQAQNDILEIYDEKPLIIYCDSEDSTKLEKFLKDNNFTKYLKGFDQIIQKEIRTWNNGLLILDPQNYQGLNTRFAKDATVLILSSIQNEQQYLQMIGRSSRSRGLCQAIYYAITSTNAQQVLSRMKINSHTHLQNLQYLLKLIWTKRNNNILQSAIETTQNAGDNLKSIKDLQQVMGQSDFKKLTRGFEF